MIPRKRAATISFTGSLALAAFFGACGVVLLVTFSSSARTPSAPIEIHLAAD